MRSIFTFTIAVLILTACSQTSPSATPMLLPSATPTRISTVTPTFLPTFTSTSTPDLTPAQSAWETHFAGSAHVSADGTVMSSEGVTIEGLRVEGDHATITHAYPELDGDEFTIVMGIEDVKINEDGSINMPGFTFDGQTMTQEHAVSNGKETKLLKVPTDVVVEMIQRETARLVAKLGEGILDPNSPTRRESKARALDWLGMTGTDLSFRLGGIQFNTINKYAYDSRIYVVDIDGKRVGEKPSIFYAFEDLKEGNQSAVAMQINGEIVRVIADAKLRNVGSYMTSGVTSFTIVQEN